LLDISRYPPGRPSALNVGILGEKGPSPPSPDPCAGAYGIAMVDRYSPSLLNPAGPIIESL
jgi:hypothetical protein